MPVETALRNQAPVIGGVVAAYEGCGFFHVYGRNESDLGCGLAIFGVFVELIEIDSKIGFHGIISYWLYGKGRAVTCPPRISLFS
mgnify:CR=1 FL=1